MRFIGGLLRLDSGALLELFGQWRFTGPGAITGDVVAEGKWTQNGDWEFNGPGDIEGDVTATGEWTQNGLWKFNGDGEITGDVELVGILTSGNVRIQDGRIYVGAAGNQIIIDGDTGKINAGGLTIDPTGGGKVTFPGGAEVKGGASGGVEMRQGNYAAVVTSTGGSIGKVGNAIAVADGGVFQLVGVPTTSGKGVPSGTLWADATGRVYRATS